jgi:cytochrome b6-f complex iron-sulfur subunit
MPTTPTRRSWMASALMGAGLLLSYGVLAVQGLLFMIPERLKATRRKLFAGRIEQYPVGSVRKFYDLDGTEILVKRGDDGFNAYSSTCPHLGCKVHWLDDKQQFFCPCHNGVFDSDGNPVSGPPADANQKMYPAPMSVDESSGVVYIEVKEPKGGRA